MPTAALTLVLLSAQSVPILPADPLQAFTLSGAPARDMQLVGVEGQPFTRAMRLRTPAPPAGGNPSAIRVRAAAVRAAQKGDTLLATFWMRCAESEAGNCAARLAIGQAARPDAKPVTFAAGAGPGWRRFAYAFTMPESCEPGQYDVQFWTGFGPQVIEIGGVAVVNYGPTPAPELAGQTRYDGWQPGAAWRAAAAERIERIRKAELAVTVLDETGKAVPGAEVRVRMKRHAFGFGTAVAAAELLGPSVDSERYREKILELYNQVVLENDLKWPQWESNRQRALDALKWLHEHGISRIRGHNLIWPGWRRMPPDIQSLKDDPAALRARILNHIEDIGEATRGQLAEWDVINEPYSNKDVQAILGDEEMAAWFRKARAADPGARLYLNDFAILAAGGNDVAHQDHYYRTVGLLDRLGAPVEGIGMQGHFSADLTPPDRVLEILDRFAGFGKPIQVTEFDINIEDAALQADYTRDFLTAVFSHPSVSGFLMWGFWEGRHWRPRGAMFRRDWSEKPNAAVYRDLVFREWWTDEKRVTGGDGTVRLRGFLGDYEVEAGAGRARATLGKEGAAVTVVAAGAGRP